MKDYSAMSDYLINQHVAESLTGRYLYFPDYVWDSEEEKHFNPCHNPADAWPIIKQAEISILKDNGLHLWCAAPSAYWADGSEWQISGEVMDANPLRAAMIVYLMMKDAEKSHG